MTDTPKEPCEETTCKEDLFQGLMSLLAQAEEAEQEEDND